MKNPPPRRATDTNITQVSQLNNNLVMENAGEMEENILRGVGNYLK